MKLQPRFKSHRSLIVLLLVLFSMGLTYFLTYQYPLSWKILKHYTNELLEFNQKHPYLTPFYFINIYILYALTSLPGIFIFSLLAGFLFVQPYSTLYVLFAATIGAALFFLMVRSACGPHYNQKEKTILAQMKTGFKKNDTHYLLFLRLIPLFPFGIVNLAGAYFGVNLFPFIWTTFIGMIPSVVVYTIAGKGMLQILNLDGSLSPGSFFTKEILIALLGLALLSLFPLFFKNSRTNPQ